MKAVISTTFDPKYLFYLPITTFCWNKLGVDVVCFMPYEHKVLDYKKIDCVNDTLRSANLEVSYSRFNAPEHKQATYAQCARLFGAAMEHDDGESLVTSDIDMLVFKKPLVSEGAFIVKGADLVPEGQYPICYISADVEYWRKTFGITWGKGYQQCLDELLGGIDSISMRSDYWVFDQEFAYKKIKPTHPILISRGRRADGYSENRLDRDDVNILSRLSPDIIDYHMNRPGYEDANFNVILTVLKFYYPNEDFTWLINYQQRFKELL